MSVTVVAAGFVAGLLAQIEHAGATADTAPRYALTVANQCAADLDATVRGPTGTSRELVLRRESETVVIVPADHQFQFQMRPGTAKWTPSGGVGEQRTTLTIDVRCRGFAIETEGGPSLGGGLQ